MFSSAFFTSPPLTQAKEFKGVSGLSGSHWWILWIRLQQESISSPNLLLGLHWWGLRICTSFSGWLEPYSLLLVLSARWPQLGFSLGEYISDLLDVVYFRWEYLRPTPCTLQSSALWIMFWVLSPNQGFVLCALILSPEGYSSAGLSIFHSPYVSCLKDSWYDVLHYLSEHHVMSPVVPSRWREYSSWRYAS